MAKVTFKNTLDTDTQFKHIDEDTLLSVVYEYARTLNNDELYQTILKEKVVLRLNNKVIHPDDWNYTEVNKDDEIVVTPVLSDTDDAGVIQTVVGLGIFVVGVVFFPEYPQIALLGLSIALGGVSQMLWEPETSTLPSSPSTSLEKSQTYNWSGVSTIAKYGTPVPIVYGTHLVGGNVISYHTESRGENNYLHVLLALAEGEIDGICCKDNISSVCTPEYINSFIRSPEIYVDDQPIENYDGVSYLYRNGTNASDTTQDCIDPSYQNIIPDFSEPQVQFSKNVPLSTSYTIHTTTAKVDSVKLQFKTPSLFEYVNGKMTSHSVYFELGYKEEDEGSYHTYNASVYDYSISYGRIQSGAPKAQSSTFSRTDLFDEYKRPPKIVLDILSNDFSNTDLNERIAAGGLNYTYRIRLRCRAYDENNKLYRDFNTHISNFVSWERYRIGSTDREGNTTYTWHATNIQHNYRSFCLVSYSCMFTLTQNVRAGNRFTLTPTTSSTKWHKIEGSGDQEIWKTIELNFHTLPNGSGYGKYKIRVRRKCVESTDPNVQDTLTWESITEVISGGGGAGGSFIYPNTALLKLKIKATNQLSGGMPNITTLIRGKKIEVPKLMYSGSTQTFDNCYWTGTEWQTSDGDTCTWDGSTYVEQYSSNPMLCVRDLLLNNRYGLGKYISEDDLYNSGIVTAIKECHKRFDFTAYPDAIDAFSWWTDEPTSYFDQYIYPESNGGGSITVDSDNRKIVFDGDSEYYTFKIHSNKPLSPLETYNLSITLSSLSENVWVSFYLNRDVPWLSNIRHLVTTFNNIGGGTQSTDITIDIVSIYGGIVPEIEISSVNNGNNLTGEITDVSLTSMSSVSDVNMHQHEFHGVLDSDQSALSALLEICSSFRCWPIWFDGKFNFIIDTDDTPVQTITMGNIVSGSFNQTFTPISEIPYKLIGQYADESNNYELRNLIAESTSNSLIKANEKTIGLKGITSRIRATREMTWKLNKVTNCVQTINFKCGLDMIHATAGDIVNIQHQLPMWGQGGRVTQASQGDKQIYLDTEYTFNYTASTHLIQCQTASNNYVTATVDTSGLSNNDATRIITVDSWFSSSPCSDAVYTIGVSGDYVQPYRITSIERTGENEVEINALEHKSSLYSESEVVVANDNYNTMPSPSKKPNPPIIESLTQTKVSEGIGFNISARPDDDGTVVEYITVQMSSTGNTGSWNTITTITVGQGGARYIDNNLALNETYYFRLFCNTKYKTSDYVQTTCYLSKDNYMLESPSGIRLKNKNQNEDEFNGKDCTIVWEEVSSSTGGTSYNVNGYIVEVYHTSVSDANLLRTVTVKNEEYTYTFENNLEDSGLSTAYPTLIFILYTVTTANVISLPSTYFTVSKSTPPNINGLTASSIAGGVEFRWTKSTHPGHKCYSYRIKVETDSWGAWTDITDNYVTRILTSTEIANHTNKATIYIQVKDKDWYDQTGAYSSTNATAHEIMDNMFNLVGSKSANPTGTVASLYNGDYDGPGGITIT